MNNNVKKRLKSRFKILYRVWHSGRVKYNEIREWKASIDFRRHGMEILKEIGGIIEENELSISCTEGTLLGLVRDGHILPWDNDLDFTISNQNEFKWTMLDDTMRKYGFWKYRTVEEKGSVIMTTYKKKNVPCDFGLYNGGSEDFVVQQYGCYQIENIQYENGEEAPYRVWDIRIPTVKGIHKAIISGAPVFLPENKEEILTGFYGERWDIPDPNFKQNVKEYNKIYRIQYYKKGIIL